jgi:guanine deaminase
MLATLPRGVTVADYTGCLIAPGFIDTHVHYVQTGIVASYGTQLLDWLDRYAFPAEMAFEDPAHAAAMARIFCDELLRNGTTTALVFCAVYPQSVDALFAEAERRGMRIAAGKVLMDRNAPEKLRDTAQQGYDDSKALIARWHGRGRCIYAITPRFAGTSTPEQLEAAGALWREHPDVMVQTHIAENRREIEWTAELFPERKNYLDIYDHYGLIGRRAVLAHGVHLSEDELCRCHQSGAALSHCPTSNMFLGSGLFRIAAAKDARRPVQVGLGTDIGGGTSFSLLATMGAAYEIAQLNGRALSAVEAFYLATLGGARAMGLEDRIGSIAPGKEADLVVLDPQATPLLALRSTRAESIEDLLFALMTLGDDRAVRATSVAGAPAYLRDA